MNVRFASRADDDIIDRIAFYEAARPLYGTRFRMALQERIELIQQYPKMFAILSGRTRAANIPKFRDVNYYRSHRDEVLIIAVVHGRRHPTAWKRKQR